MARRQKKSWSDLTPGQRALALGAAGLQVGLLVTALADIRRRPPDQVRGSKAIWVAVSFINFVGPLAYFRFGRRR